MLACGDSVIRAWALRGLSLTSRTSPGHNQFASKKSSGIGLKDYWLWLWLFPRPLLAYSH